MLHESAAPRTDPLATSAARSPDRKCRRARQQAPVLATRSSSRNRGHANTRPPGQRVALRIAPAIDSSGITLSTPFSLIASFGIPKTTQVASSCAMVFAPACFHLQHAPRPVVAHPGQNHADRVRPRIARRRTEQHIHRRPVPAHQRPFPAPPRNSARRCVAAADDDSPARSAPALAAPYPGSPLLSP